MIMIIITIMMIIIIMIIIIMCVRHFLLTPVKIFFNGPWGITMVTSKGSNLDNHLDVC